MSNTYRFVISGPRTLTKIDTAPGASQAAAAALLLNIARIWDADATIAPMLYPFPLSF